MIPADAVHQAVVLTFEEMAFLDVASGPSPKPAEPSGDDGPVLFLGYSRPSAGSFVLFLPKAVKFAVAESIYGEDWTKLSAAQLDDSLLELMNVLAGRLLTLLFGSAGYAMGLPTVLYDPPEDLPGRSSEFRFHTDEKEFTLVWSEEAP